MNVKAAQTGSRPIQPMSTAIPGSSHAPSLPCADVQSPPTGSGREGAAPWTVEEESVSPRGKDGTAATAQHWAASKRSSRPAVAPGLLDRWNKCVTKRTAPMDPPPRTTHPTSTRHARATARKEGEPPQTSKMGETKHRGNPSTKSTRFP